VKRKSSAEVAPEVNEPILPKIPYQNCPVRVSLSYLGRKWAILIIRNLAIYHDQSFSQLLHGNSGLTARELSIRLRELQKEGVIFRVQDKSDRRRVHYRLTKQGEDAVPILTAIIQYGIRHHAARVFKDKKPRELGSLYPERHKKFMLGRLQKFALDGLGKRRL
jgi:DNA-binding HxlR family transcriptional regulator